MSAWTTAVSALSPIAWFRLDDTNTTGVDSAISPHNGTYSGSYSQSAASLLVGDADTACTFTAGSMLASTVPAIGTGDYTAIILVNASSVAGLEVALAIGDTAWIGVNGGDWTAKGGTAVVTGPAAVTSDIKFLTLRRLSGTITFRVSGTNVGSTADATTLPAGLRVGTFPGGFNWAGVADEVLLFSTALTDPQVANLESIASGASTPPTIGTIGAVASGGTDTITYPAPTAGSNPVAGCSLYFGTSPGGESGTAYATNLGTGGGTFMHPSPTVGVTNYYVVKAFDNAGTPNFSAASNEVSTTASTTIAVTDANLFVSPIFTYSDGGGARGANGIKGGSTYFWWNGTPMEARLSFTGSTTISLNVDVSRMVADGIAPSDYPYLTWKLVPGSTSGVSNWNAWSAQRLVTNADTSISLVTGLNPATTYTLILQYDYRNPIDVWTDPAVVRFTGFVIDAAGSTAALGWAYTAKPALIVESDSILEAIYTTIGYTSGSSLYSIARLVALGLGMEVAARCFRSSGYTVVGTGNVPDVVDRFGLIAAGKPALASGAFPGSIGAVLLLVGHNDAFAADGTVTTAVQTTITNYRAATSPTTPILVCLPLSGSKASAITAGRTAYIAANPSDTHTYLIDTGLIGQAAQTIDGAHLTSIGSAEIASLVAAKVQTAIGGGGGAGGGRQPKLVKMGG